MGTGRGRGRKEVAACGKACVVGSHAFATSGWNMGSHEYNPLTPLASCQMRLRPLYTHPNANVDDEAVVGNGHGGGGGGTEQQLDAGRAMELLQYGLFMGEGGFEGERGGAGEVGLGWWVAWLVGWVLGYGGAGVRVTGWGSQHLFQTPRYR